MPATINGTSGFGGNLTGNVTGNADTATTAGKFSTTSGDAPTYACRAWVNFDGDDGSTVDGEFRCTIRASGNVSKVVRAATGDFTVHFTTAMPDANYAPMASVNYSDAATANRAMNQFLTTAPTTTACRFIVQNGQGANENPTGAYVAIFR
jgi:hypothetical protein